MVLKFEFLLLFSILDNSKFVKIIQLRIITGFTSNYCSFVLSTKNADNSLNKIYIYNSHSICSNRHYIRNYTMSYIPNIHTVDFLKLPLKYKIYLPKCGLKKIINKNLLIIKMTISHK